jgi:hypothetical protein
LYTGDAVVNNNFDLSLSNLGSNDIFYTYTDSSGCSGTVGSTIIVYPLPSINLSSITVCANDNPSLLNIGSPSGGDYLGTGVNNNIFFPANANLGNNTISYSYSDSLTGCTAIDSIILMVNSIPSVSFSISNPTQVCSNETPFLLGGGLPSGGTYSGPGVNNNIFNPANANIGNNIITYTYTDGNGCTNSTTQIITILQSPSPDTFFDFTTGQTQTSFIWDYQNSSAFTMCYSVGFFSPLHMVLSNISLTQNTDSIYEIDWGDGSPIYTANNLPSTGTDTLHTYSSTGAFNLTLIVTGQNECISYDTISVFLGNTPEVSLENPGGLDFCVTNEIVFPITGTDNNPPGTIYTISSNTGDPDYIFPHPPDSSYSHIFNETSCGAEFSNGSVSNFFYIDILAVNACGNGFNSVGPINASIKPNADIDISPTDSLACINSIVTFTNNSNDGSNVSGGTSNTASNCFSLAKRKWEINPPSNYNIVNGQLGDITSNQQSTWGSNTLEIIFTDTGTYEIHLILENSCGYDTAYQTVCIVDQPDASFIADNYFGCLPSHTINTTNNSGSLSDCFTPQFFWSVQQSASACNDSSLWNFANGSSNNSIDPTFIFSDVGEYDISLEVSNECGSITHTENIIISDIPELILFPIPNYCDTTSITPTAIIDDCLTPIINYQWSFPNGNPPNSNINVPSPITYNQAGSYTITLDATNLCGVGSSSESFTIDSSTSSFNTIPIVMCDSFFWNDSTYYSTGIYSYTTLNSNGCDSTAFLNLIINYSDATTDIQEACDSYTWIDGITYTASNNSATFNYTNSAGCDSTITLNLTINYSDATTDIQEACDSYTWIDGITYTASNNSATFNYTNSAGCDSTITLNLTINYSDATTDIQEACDSYTWIDGITYTASNNSATFNFTNSAGCDSTITLNLTINYSDTTTDIQEACDSYTWIDGITYTASNNSATFNYTNSAGCDSTITLNLTINYSDTTTDIQEACDSYTWIDGITYTASNNSATFNFTNSAGCDSTITLNLTINYSDATTDIQEACDSYTWIDGITYTASNNSATFNFTNSAGCDSIVTLNLTINYSDTTTDIQEACDSYTWIDGITYTASNNSATFNYTNSAGCDSTITLNLTINYSDATTDIQEACDSYTWIDGITYTASNNSATFNFTNSAGCDSTITLNLTINYSDATTDIQEACDSYTWIDGITYTASNNSATFNFTNSAGCDSTVTLNLTINTQANIFITT